MYSKIINVKNLNYKYGVKPVLVNINFTVMQGEIIGIIGSNGAGKSTFLKCLTGAINNYEGEINILDTSQISSFLEEIGILTESIQLFNFLTVSENLKILNLIGRRKIDIQLIDYFGLSKFINTKFESLSLGNKQKLGLAIALNPINSLFILDEPLNGLDPIGIIKFRELMTEYKLKKKAILISSHILSELDKYCTHYVFIGKNNFSQKSSRDELINKYGTIENAYYKYNESY